MIGAIALLLLQSAAIDAGPDGTETLAEDNDALLAGSESYDDGYVEDGYDDVDLASLKRIFVRDSQEATEVEVEHPLQPICMRKMLPGSRVKARTMCQDKTSWIAYRTSLDAMTDAWGTSGIALEPGGDPTPGKSFGMGR
ncbi:hypothetical protein [Erythrobacter litoralis]|nr:hypothetical protein [Erythrobacter litoralis]